MNEIDRGDTSAGDNGPPVDMEGFRAVLREAGIEAIAETLIETFLRDATGRIEALNEAVRAADAEAIGRTAHAYKSSAAQIHAIRLADALLQTEIAAREGDVERAIALAAGAAAEHERVMKFLNAV